MRFNDRSRKPNLRPVVFFLIIIVLAVFAISKIFRPNQIGLTVDSNIKNCSGNIDVFASLSDSSGSPIKDESLLLTISNQTYNLQTDNNGRLWYRQKISQSLCDSNVSITVKHSANLFYQSSNASSYLYVKAPTYLQMISSGDIYESQNATMLVKLTNSFSGLGIPNKTILIGINNVTSNESGEFLINQQLSRHGIWQATAEFMGDEFFEPSSSKPISIEVKQLACTDGTLMNKCSGSNLCTSNLSLSFNCNVCGCQNGLICFSNQCMSEEEKTESLINRLQLSSVYITTDSGLGSGVIVYKENGQTLILTNRHVIDNNFDFVADRNIEIINFYNETARPMGIIVAPNDVDLALITISKDLGPVADVAANYTVVRGADILALGSPLGFHNSVSKGIVSNIVSSNTESGYRFTAIQIDAAVNPGNSGGGIFLTQNGKLIGITTYKSFIKQGQLAEGLGFALPVNLISKLDNWRPITPG